MKLRAFLIASCFTLLAVPLAPAQEKVRSKSATARRGSYVKAYDWMVKDSKDPERMVEYGSDFLQFFYEIKSSAGDKELRERAAKDGLNQAKRCLAYFKKKKDLTLVEEVTEAIAFLALAREFGVKKEASFLYSKVNLAMKTMSFRALFNLSKGERSNDAEDLCDAVIAFHFARRAGLQEGKGLKWAMSQARAYKYDAKATDEDFLLAQDNLVTHVIYVMSDYGRVTLKASNYKAELAYMRAAFKRVYRDEDVEGVAEFIDSSRILGIKDSDPMIRKGLRWLMTVQKADGSFGEGDEYDVYHSTWTALNALRPFRFQGKGPTWDLTK
ncbi:MAG: hypothetical protein P1V97_06460 [Planctomycetota bacterium]|nr:hypothetical protein [Planctomycetota bacterium]